MKSKVQLIEDSRHVTKIYSATRQFKSHYSKFIVFKRKNENSFQNSNHHKKKVLHTYVDDIWFLSEQ